MEAWRPVTLHYELTMNWLYFKPECLCKPEDDPEGVITRQQLFHAWRCFHFDQNAEAIDA